MNSIYDLLYIGDREGYTEVKTLAEAIPGAKVSDGSDEIHRYRLVFEHDDLPEDDYLLWLMRNGLHGCSFTCQLYRMDNPKRLLPLIKQVVAEQAS